jgi:ATP-dependent DNA helicase RecG
VEFKEVWRDEYLKWICGFANSAGGTLCLGLDDKGSVQGLADARRLLEEIPNKVASHLGIMVEVRSHSQGDKDWLEVVVPPSDLPIAFHGVYHCRSGSTRQELKGAALQQFLLRKMGRSWDDLAPESAALDDLDPQAVANFLGQARHANRLPSRIASDELGDLLGNLRLLGPGSTPTHAALLLFGKDPQRFFRMASFRIGRFGNSDSDLLHQDVIEGNLLSMPGKVMEILRSKYLVSPIRYEGLQRVEELELPEEALREAILNAVVHKDYTGSHIQLSVYDEKLVLWNPGLLPEGLGVEDLRHKHPSRPRNSNIAEIFFKAGLIEIWGRGIDKILEACAKAEIPEPRIEEHAGGVQVTFFRSRIPPPITPPITPSITPPNRREQVLAWLREHPEGSLSTLARLLGIRADSVKEHVERLKQDGTLRREGGSRNGRWVAKGDDR